MSLFTVSLTLAAETNSSSGSESGSSESGSGSESEESDEESESDEEEKDGEEEKPKKKKKVDKSKSKKPESAERSGSYPKIVDVGGRTASSTHAYDTQTVCSVTVWPCAFFTVIKAVERSRREAGKA